MPDDEIARAYRIDEGSIFACRLIRHAAAPDTPTGGQPMSFAVARQIGRLVSGMGGNYRMAVLLSVAKIPGACPVRDFTPASPSTESKGRPSAIVAIPVRNERDRIVACLSSLAAQVGREPGSFGIVLFANNCTDDTCDVIRTLSSMPWPLRLIETTDPAASAGRARRKAMDAAADWLSERGHENGILLTTDADSRVGVKWFARNLENFAEGADAVAGRITLEAHEAALLPERLHARGRLEAEYEAILTEIGARLDPEPGNSWPCPWSKSGATMHEVAMRRTRPSAS